MKWMKALSFVGFGWIVAALGCGPQPKVPEDGAYYSVAGEEGDFQVVKVLAVEAGAVHVRLYKNRFSERPSELDVNELSLGSIDDPEGFGMGHLPLSEETFFAWEPVFLFQGTVSPDELEGYETWKESHGGLF